MHERRALPSEEERPSQDLYVYTPSSNRKTHKSSTLTLCITNTIHLLHTHTGLLQRLSHHRQHPLPMMPRGVPG
jgi:hypothetical protein